MIHWYTCIEFVIIACFATLVFMVWWACRSEETDYVKEARELNEAYSQGYQVGRANGEDAWKTRNGFKYEAGEDGDSILYRGYRYYERPF